MNHKRIIWIIQDNKIQLYTELRKQWNVQNYNGNVYLPIEDITADGIISKEEKEALSTNYIDKICRSSGIQIDTYIHALFIYEYANMMMSELYQYFKDWVDNHNLNLKFDTLKWDADNLTSILLGMGEESIVKDCLDTSSINSIGRTLQIATSKGTIYEEKKIKRGSETALNKDDKKDSNTGKYSQKINEQIVLKVDTSTAIEEPKVQLAKSRKLSNDKSNKDNNKKYVVRSKKNDVNHFNNTNGRKVKASNEELRKVLLEETKDFNHTVREPR